MTEDELEREGPCRISAKTDKTGGPGGEAVAQPIDFKIDA